MKELWQLPPALEPAAERLAGRWAAAPPTPAPAPAAAVSDAGADIALRRRVGWATPVGVGIAALAAAAGAAFTDRPTFLGLVVVAAIVAAPAFLLRRFGAKILGRLDGELGEREALRGELVAARRAREELRALAYHDTLTGLPNRNLLLDRLAVAIAHARRQQTRLAVLFLDLDDFKTMNDSFGHDFGDRLLVELAGRIRVSVRAGDTVARFGGDEFVVLLDGVNGAADAAHVAAKVLEALRAPFRVDGRLVKVATSVGMSVFPDDAATCHELLRQADAAMYRDKQDEVRSPPSTRREG